jgi:hypothetical protein
MDIQPQETKPISDDQELAKVLAGVSRDNDTNFSYEETPAIIPLPTPTPVPIADPIKKDAPLPPVFGYNAPTDESPKTALDNGNLESIKKDALKELRPLVDKLDLSPEEKFDIYLLLLRSTDDTTLIAPAHETARAIPDESKRAQALLDIIKEIDFLSTPAQTSI